MIIRPQSAYPDLLTLFYNNVDRDVENLWVDENGNPSSFEECYRQGRVLECIAADGSWLPVELVKILAGAELTSKEKMSLTETFMSRNWQSGAPDDRTHFLISGKDSYAIAREDIHRPAYESGGHNVKKHFYRAKYGVYDKKSYPPFHVGDAWERFYQFFMSPKSSGESLPTRLIGIFDDVHQRWKSASYDDFQSLDRWRALSADKRNPFDEIPSAPYAIEEIAQLEGTNDLLGRYSGFMSTDCSNSIEVGTGINRGDLWLGVRHLWRSPNWLGSRYPEFGMTWSWWYGLLVFFGIAVLLGDLAVSGASVFPVFLGIFLIPIAVFWLAPRFFTVRQVWLAVGGIFVLGVLGRLWVIGDPTGIIDPTMAILTFGVGVVVGLYPVYWGGFYRRVLRNADKYGPFACVWFRPWKDGVTGKDGVEFVLTDNNGEIVWIRRMSKRAAKRFTGQFVYEHPDSGVWDFFGAEEHWRQVFPALICPREVVRDWKYWWKTMKYSPAAFTPNGFLLEDVSLIKDRAWWTWLFRETILYRPETLSDALMLNVPGLSYVSRDAYISEFGLDKHPRGYEQALRFGRLVGADAKY